MLSPPSAEDDILAAQPPTIVRAGGGAVLGAGAMALLVVVQSVSGFILFLPAKVGLGLLAVFGLGAAVAGLRLMRARAGSAIAALVAAVMLLFVSSGWLLFSMAGGLLSLFALFLPLLAATGLVLAAMSIGACRRVNEARARLAAQGMSLGT